MNLINFNYNNIIVRTQVTDDGEPLFCLADICAVLELTNPSAVAAQIKEEFETPKLNLGVIQRQTGKIEVPFVTESQLYFVLLRSRSENAKPFRQWVVNEVLPSIRKTGSYSTGTQAPDLKLKFELAKMMLEPAGIVGNQLTLALDKVYKANVGESLLAQSGVELKADTQNQLFTPTELGKQINISGQKFNSALDILGYQTKVNKVWELTQLGKEKGGTYLDVGKKHSDGTPVRQLKWPMSVLGSIKQLLKGEE